MDQSKHVMTVEDVAEYLQIHPLIVRRLARENRLPVVKVGRQWRTLRPVMDRWFEEASMKNVAHLFEQGQS